MRLQIAAPTEIADALGCHPPPVSDKAVERAQRRRFSGARRRAAP
jgi:hypothetical protein